LVPISCASFCLTAELVIVDCPADWAAADFQSICMQLQVLWQGRALTFLVLAQDLEQLAAFEHTLLKLWPGDTGAQVIFLRNGSAQRKGGAGFVQSVTQALFARVGPVHGREQLHLRDHKPPLDLIDAPQHAQVVDPRDGKPIAAVERSPEALRLLIQTCTDHSALVLVLGAGNGTAAIQAALLQRRSVTVDEDERRAKAIFSLLRLTAAQAHRQPLLIEDDDNSKAPGPASSSQHTGQAAGNAELDGEELPQAGPLLHNLAAEPAA
jgi:hypothetical protein